MKTTQRLLSLFALFILFSAQSLGPNNTTDSEKRVFFFEIRDEIGPPSWRKTQKAIAQAIEQDADLIILTLNTYGGLVDAADSMRTKILNCPIPIFVLIENNAASAGALISIACDSIYMTPGSTIGAATVVNQEGQAVPDKYQSYMRKKMRATAEQTGRNPDMAEAMVDPDKEVLGVSEKGKVLTFTSREAIEYGFCEAQVSSTKEVLARNKINDYTKLEYSETFIDQIIALLINPAVSGILIILIIGGIYFELQSPGIGFPLIISVLAAVAYFAPLYIEGLAENWEIVVFIIGLLLIALEIFVIPGFGVAGISGIILTMGGLILSMVNNIGFNFEPINFDKLVTAILVVLVSSSLSVAGSIFLGVKLLQSSLIGKLVLNSVQDSNEGFISVDQKQDLVGKQGITITVLRPSGKIEIEGELIDANALEGYIEEGSRVQVVKYETSQVTVVSL